jgi:geranylgeranyl diphosphate synthase type II
MSPCRLGAIAAGHTRSLELDLLTGVFCEIGVAFQIQDDLLNLLGKEELYGKEPLGDLLEGKRTLMVIHLLRTLTGARRAEILEWLVLPRSDKRQVDAERVVASMHEVGSIDYCKSVAAERATRGALLFEERLAFLPESEPKAVLRQIAHFVNTREL